MLLPGPAQRVLIHVNEDSASGGDYLHLEVSLGPQLKARPMRKRPLRFGFFDLGGQQLQNSFAASRSSAELPWSRILLI